jgi:hypothetical protein
MLYLVRTAVVLYFVFTWITHAAQPLTNAEVKLNVQYDYSNSPKSTDSPLWTDPLLWGVVTLLAAGCLALFVASRSSRNPPPD